MTEESPHHYVQPEMPEARVDRLWLGVETRLHARIPWWRRAPVLVAAALALVLAAGALLHLRPPRPVTAGARIETAREPRMVALADESELRLAPGTAISVHSNDPSAIELALTKGEVLCDVTHREGRRFIVRALDVEVRVVGTQFRVKVEPTGGSAAVDVVVTRGAVEVRSIRRPGVVTHVGAGKTWAQTLREGPAPAPGARAPSPLELPRPEPAARSPSTVQEREAVTARTDSSRELFEKAAASRRAGDAGAAARFYEELLTRYPSDRRAGLSAFELGRLKMDRLRDTGGAIRSLERALALGIGSSFREDALARLASAYAARGELRACARSRDLYLKSYPSGVHATSIVGRCGPR